MATEVQLYRSGAWEAIDYADWSIDIGISPRMVAPEASVTTYARVPVQTGQSARIVIDGSVAFEGATESGGSKRSNGQQNVSLRHPVTELWEADASVDLSGPPTDLDVLEVAITDAGTAVSTTDLTYAGTATTLNNAYQVENRSVKSIFRDMMDRTGRVWWVGPATGTIRVEPKGYRGSFGSFTTGQDRGFTVGSFDSGSVDTVRNDVTVVGTGEEAVTGSAEDQTSIDQYGRHSQKYNVEYAISQSEANALAEELLQPTPIPEGEVQFGKTISGITDPLVNYVVDIADPGKDIDADGVLLETQTIEQGRATCAIGGGVGESVAEHNRQAKSDGDNSKPGSVYNTDRIADGAIAQEKLVDASVIESKLADLSVTLNKVDFDAIDETKIQDDAVRTPQLFAGAVTAEKLNTELARAERLLAGEIQALDIATDTLTANQIDVLNLTSDEITIGIDSDEQIVFSTGEDTTNIFDTQMRPTLDGSGSIGDSNYRFAAYYGGTFFGDNVSSAGLDLTDDARQTVEITYRNSDYDSGNSRIEPTGGSTDLGTTFLPWETVYANNFSTQTPEQLDRVSYDDIIGYNWRKPPAYVAQRETDGDDQTGYVRANPAKEGIELGHVANYLFEVTKSQSEMIDAQQDRIDSLEQRLSRLEEQV